MDRAQLLITAVRCGAGRSAATWCMRRIRHRASCIRSPRVGPGSCRAWIVYQFRESLQKLAARNVPGAKRGEVMGMHLAVNEAYPQLRALAHKRREGDFRGVARVGEHRLAEEHRTHG